MKWLIAIAVLWATPAVAWAVPGQSEKQLATWGKSVSALHGFKSQMDQETAGTVYMATLAVDGMPAEFSAKPQAGIVRQ